MKFTGYHHERPSKDMERKLRAYNNSDQKVAVWNAFVDSDLTGITDDDFSVIPRVLPASYFPTIKKSAYLVTKFAMELLSLPEKDIRAIIPKGPIRDHLLDRLQVARHRTGRITGSFRFDMAIVGEAVPGNAPKLLEINEIGFDGLARSTFFQNTFLDLMPNLRKRLRGLDTAAAEIRNMNRLGKKIARVQYDSYNWDEEYLLRTAQKMKSDVRLVSPKQFPRIHKDYSLLQKEDFTFKKNRAFIGDWSPDAINFSFAYELHDYREGHGLYSRIIKSKTPQYGPFLSGLVAAKTILVVMDDPALRKRLLGSSRFLADSILPAHLLSDDFAGQSLQLPEDWVLKFTDGCGGEQVYMNKDLVRQVKKIPRSKRHEWVLQKKTELNLIDVNGILSRPKRAISDLGVFVQYDWSRGKFLNFEVGGLMTRATNRSLKVNVSGGGLQAAVLLDRGN